MQSGIKIEEQLDWGKIYENLNSSAPFESIVSQFENPTSLLLKALLNRKWEVITILLEKFPEEIDINVAPTEGEDQGLTVLWFAAISGKWSIVQTILEKFSVNNINLTSSNDKYVGKTVLWYAAHLQKWTVVNIILKKFPNANVNVAPITGNHVEKTALYFMAIWDEWNIVLSILKNPLLIVDISSLFTKPRKKNISILERILARRINKPFDKEIKKSVVIQILMHYILSAQCKDFNEVQSLLNQFKKNVLPTASVEETWFLKKQITYLITEYHRGKTIFDHSPELYINNVLQGKGLPIEMRWHISEFVTPAYFTGEQMRKFIAIPFKRKWDQDLDKYYNDLIEINFHRELTNLTRKALYSWEENHLHLALFKQPINKKTKLNIGFCLRRNLRHILDKQINRAELIEKLKTNFSYQIIPTKLFNDIIEKISNLTLENLNKRDFVKAIEDVLISFNGDVTSKKRKANLLNKTKNKREQQPTKVSRTKEKQSISSITAAFFRNHRPLKAKSAQTKKTCVTRLMNQA